MIDHRFPASFCDQHPGLSKVVEALRDAADGARIVGGAVRDSLLGIDVTDVDLATKLLPDAVIDRLEAARIKAIPTGLAHGTVTAVAEGKNYEITTLRRDVATDGRRATVAFSNDWREDASRRDFTINALYADPQSGEIFDYFGGLDDLESGIVRFIGKADERIAEDHLRILRYFRFLARFGGATIDETALQACATGASKLTALSRERIAQELVKTAMADNPVHAVALMIDHRIFDAFLPEVTADAATRLQTLIAREHKFGLPPSLPARLLAILPRDLDAVEKIAARLKLSNRLRESLAIRVVADETTLIRAIAYRCGVACARDVALLYGEDETVDSDIDALDGWDVPTFPIKGGDLIALGLPAGPLVAQTMNAVERLWVKEGFPSAERAAAIADQAVVEALLATRNSKAASDVNGLAK